MATFNSGLNSALNSTLLRLGPGGDFVTEVRAGAGGSLERVRGVGAVNLSNADGDSFTSGSGNGRGRGGREQPRRGMLAVFDTLRELIRGVTEPVEGLALGPNGVADLAIAGMGDRDLVSPGAGSRDELAISALALRVGTLLAAERVLDEQRRVMQAAASLARSTFAQIARLAQGEQHAGGDQATDGQANPASSTSGTLLNGFASVSGDVELFAARRSEAAAAFGTSFGSALVPARPDTISSRNLGALIATRSCALPGRDSGRACVSASTSRTSFDTVKESHPYESDSETTSYSAADPRLPRPQWLFADDAGTRRSDRRQQGHGLRARRGADQKGRTHARPQQGTLFVHR